MQTVTVVKGPDSVTESIGVWPVTGCDIPASRGAYHPTLLHVSNNLFCQGFFQGSIGSMMNLVCVLLLHGKNYNTIRWGNYCIEREVLHFLNGKNCRITGTNYTNEASSQQNVLFIIICSYYSGINCDIFIVKSLDLLFIVDQ